MLQQSSVRRIRKRSFQLFEILVSLALIITCLFPLIKPLWAMRTKDKKYLEDIQLEAAAQNAFCYIKEILYENQTHPWSALGSEVSGTLPKSFPIIYNKSMHRDLLCNYTIKRPFKDAKKTSFNTLGRVIQIEITFQTGQEEPTTFYRTLYLERQL